MVKTRQEQQSPALFSGMSQKGSGKFLHFGEHKSSKEFNHVYYISLMDHVNLDIRMLADYICNRYILKRTHAHKVVSTTWPYVGSWWNSRDSKQQFSNKRIISI